MKLKKYLLPLLNPVKLFKAYRYQKKQPKYDKSNRDLELWLYSKILKNDMLHYGYFKDPNIHPLDISIGGVEQAQLDYADLIAQQLPVDKQQILDVGCGMGGLAYILQKKGHDVLAVTPDVNQKKHIDKKYPDISCVKNKFEDFESDQSFDAIIHSESLQYINLQSAIQKVDKLLTSNGYWVVTDYFRLHAKGVNKSGHQHENFLTAIKDSPFQLVKEQDITQNCLPTLRLVNLYVERFLEPITIFGIEKLKVKSPWLYYLTNDLRNALGQKATKELASVDPEKFQAEKKYMLYVLKRK